MQQQDLQQPLLNAHRWKVLILLSFQFWLFMQTASAIVRDVPTSYTTIQGAINAAAPGDIVRVQPGTYSPVTNGETFPIDLKSDITVFGIDKGSCVVDANFSSAVFRVASVSSCTLENFQIRNGGDALPNGIRIENSSAITVSHTRIENAAGDGIVIFNSTGTAIINNHILNSGDSGIQTDCSPTIEGNLIQGSARDGIACLGSLSEPIIRSNTLISNGLAAFGSCGIWCDSSIPLIEKNIFDENRNGIIILGSAQPDIGMGARNSIGLNIFKGGVEYDIKTAQPGQILAKNNRWSSSNPDDVIYDHLDNSDLGRILVTPVAVILFESDFDTMPTGEYYGNWSIIDGALRATGTFPDSYFSCYFGDASWQNYLISFRVRGLQGSDFGLLMRATGGGFAFSGQQPTYLLQKLGEEISGDLRVFRYPQPTRLGPIVQWPEYDQSNWHQFYVTVNGSKIDVRFDEYYSFSVEDPDNTYPTGKVGFRVFDLGTATWDFDDLTIYQLPGFNSVVSDWELYE